MILKTDGNGHGSAGPISVTCPGCGRDATFEIIPNIQDFIQGKLYLGQRRCPNKKCRTHIFVIIENNELKASYPAQRIDFDTADIPEKIIKIFDEAISCHSNQLFVSSAIMVRRTLEEICSDKNAKGVNLKTRIKNLSNKIVLPKELISGMNELRLLGNDAAHVKASVFQNIGKKELDVAIKFTKEILKSVYQYGSLLKELQDLKQKENNKAT